MACGNGKPLFKEAFYVHIIAPTHPSILETKMLDSISLERMLWTLTTLACALRGRICKKVKKLFLIFSNLFVTTSMN